MSSNAPQSPPEAPLLQLLRPRQPEAASSPPNLYLLLSRAASTAQRRGGTSILVRETAARELEERRADWGYSKPVVALDIMWNLGFVIVTIVMLFCTIQEEPNVPIRVWVCGYALQCLVHILLVWIEFRRRNSRQERSGVDDGSTDEEILIESEEENEDRVGHLGRANNTRLKRCESLNTMASFVWWIVGIYWITLGGDALLQGAPRLYWLTVVFLAFDVIFALLCVVLACFLGIALCCCLPCIIAILYAIAGQEGATDADLSTLPKYGFQACKDEGRKEIVAGKMIPLETTSGYTTNERVLLPEDAECSICLNTYEDGTELTALPCNHHYHSACIVKWLKMNATCPLCKFNILKGNTQV